MSSTAPGAPAPAPVARAAFAPDVSARVTLPAASTAPPPLYSRHRHQWARPR
ncbi:hypothetical protein ABTZ58_34765 [Streptomyces sp. NPDC094143]|uniref:hypothetical protein n=1 Tax=Streptomyces sp. NPDC094143 TaxID=3155310 RepID=UPI003327FA00